MATDMQNGAFRRDNMDVPKGDRVLPMFSLKGRTAIVSGAGAGIGLAVAQAYAEAGANVAIWYNSNKQALTEAENIEKTYGVKCTLTRPMRRIPVLCLHAPAASVSLAKRLPNADPVYQ